MDRQNRGEIISCCTIGKDTILWFGRSINKGSGTNDEIIDYG